MRKKIIIGNWKMNKTTSEAMNFMKEFNDKISSVKIPESMEYGIAAPATILKDIFNKSHKGFIVSAENMSQYDSGAYTGEISADMVLDTGAKAVVIGHSERRQYWNEKDKDVNEKAIIALKKGLLPIVCVGETLEQYESNQTKDIVKSQVLAALKGIDPSKVVIAYEPIWAIGTGKTATAEIAQDICKYIRSITSEETLIQYGGSVNPANVSELMSQPDIDGALVGGASMEVESFIKILTLNK